MMRKISLKSTLIVLFGLWAIGCGFFSGLPSDESLEKNFRAHEADFKKLVSMFNEDANLNYVNEEAAYLNSNQGSPKAELPPQRLAEYHRLFKKTGAKIVLRGSNRTTIGGWSEGDLDISYVYAENQPIPLIDSRDHLDKLPVADGLHKVGYKKIADKWYLKYRKYVRSSVSADNVSN